MKKALFTIASCMTLTSMGFCQSKTTTQSSVLQPDGQHVTTAAFEKMTRKIETSGVTAGTTHDARATFKKTEFAIEHGTVGTFGPVIKWNTPDGCDFMFNDKGYASHNSAKCTVAEHKKQSSMITWAADKILN